MCGCEVNNLFVDILNDQGLEQLVNSLTRKRNTLDLMLTTQLNMLSETQVILRILNHEAVFLNQACAWFLEITFTTLVCAFVCVCLCVCVCP